MLWCSSGYLHRVFTQNTIALPTRSSLLDTVTWVNSAISVDRYLCLIHLDLKNSYISYPHITQNALATSASAVVKYIAEQFSINVVIQISNSIHPYLSMFAAQFSVKLQEDSKNGQINFRYLLSIDLVIVQIMGHKIAFLGCLYRNSLVHNLLRQF